MRTSVFKREFLRSCGRASLLLAAAAVSITPAHAAFHLWNIREIYTDASGSLQFIELFCPASSQQFVGGQQIHVSNVGNTQSHTFTLGSNLPGDTLNHALLFGTAGLQSHGGPTPDYIIPDGFLFTAGGSISFFGANSGSYPTLPIDGINSRAWTGGAIAANSPVNYGGVSGFVVVPEPGACVLLGLGCIAGLLRRRNIRI